MTVAVGDSQPVYADSPATVMVGEQPKRQAYVATAVTVLGDPM